MIQGSHLVFVFALYILRPACCLICPKLKGSDPQGVNERILKVASESELSYEYQVIDASDPSEIFTYEVKLCQVHRGDFIAVTQTTSKKPKTQKPVIIGKFQPAPDVFGGVDWALIKYKSGDRYKHHCNGSTRSAVIMLTCNPDVKKGTMIVLEEYRDKKDPGCYYLFELNVAGVCTVKASSTKLSAGSIMIIILVVVASLFFSLGFLYMRFIVGAKGKEQIPNYSFWREFGNLLADGCNFICISNDNRPTRYKFQTMDDAIGDDNEDDERDETRLPM